MHYTLLVLIDFCPVQSDLNLEFCSLKFLTFYQKLNGISDLGLTILHFEFLSLYSHMSDQTYVNTGSKTQNIKELSLDLIFHIISGTMT